MKTTHWLVAFALCSAGVGSAMAASMDTQDTDGTSRVSSDVVSAHEASGGDAAGLNHDGATRSTGGDANTNNAGNSSSHSGSTTSAPVLVRQPRLGWQSLLPGSIQ